MEGRPGNIYHVNDVSVYLGRQRGGRVPCQKKKNKLGAWSCSFCLKCWSHKRSWSEKHTALGSNVITTFSSPGEWTVGRPGNEARSRWCLESPYCAPTLSSAYCLSSLCWAKWIAQVLVDVQVVSCHSYPVIFHPIVEQLTIFYIPGLLL